MHMKISDILYEVRRGGDALNPKVSVNSQIAASLEEADPIAGVANSFVSFTELDKLGVNPRSPYQTPLGIYSYPSEYIQKTVGSGGTMSKLPFAGKSPFANIFAASGNIINLTNITQSEVRAIYTRLAKLYHSKVGGDWKSAVDWIESVTVAAQTNALHADYPGGQLWYTTREVASRLGNSKPDSKLSNKHGIAIDNRVAVAWNRLFRDLGIDGCVDMDPDTRTGVGIIHGSEPTQAVFFSTRAVGSVQRVHNKYSPDQQQKARLKSFRAIQNQLTDDEILKYLMQDPLLIAQMNRVSEPLALHILDSFDHMNKTVIKRVFIEKRLVELLYANGQMSTSIVERLITAPALKMLHMDDPEIQRIVVAKDGENISLIFDQDIIPDESIQSLAIRTTTSAFTTIASAMGGRVSPAIERLGITLNPTAISYLDNPSPEAQMIAVTREPSTISYIDNPTPEAQFKAYTLLTAEGRLVSVPPEMQRAIVDANPRAARLIRNLIPELKNMGA